MNIERDQNGGFVFSEVEQPIAEMFLSIPSALEPDGNRAAHARLFPDPAGGKDEKISQEWADYVVPELREGFENAAVTVEGDLGSLIAGEALTIPLAHVDAWLNALNQARLVLAARFEVTEEDMNNPEPFDSQNEREMAISQIHVFGLLQECLIQGLGEGLV
jgi:hypothetical protein